MIRFDLRKCHRNKDRDQKPKPSKPETINETNATTKKLTDLNDDCLERIFLYLSLYDLLNIVDTNKHLKTAAELAFTENFGREKKFIWHDHWVGVCVEICINETKQLKLLPKPFRLLRCFGHLISKQEINKSCKLNAYKLLKYVNKYCSESTTEILIRHKRFFYENKPYPNAETVRLEYCFLKENGTRFRTNVRLNELFPNVRNLSIDCCDFKRKCIAVHFPQLNQLEIVDPPGWNFKSAFESVFISRKKAYHNNTYVKMLHLNPQLRSLTLGRDYIATLLRVASQQLQLLEHLELYTTGFQEFGEGVVNFPYLKELKITYFSCFGPRKIPISASNLRTFEFCSSAEFNVDILLDFLHNHPTLTKFKLTEKNEHKSYWSLNSNES